MQTEHRQAVNVKRNRQTDMHRHLRDEVRASPRVAPGCVSATLTEKGSRSQVSTSPMFLTVTFLCTRPRSSATANGGEKAERCKGSGERDMWGAGCPWAVLDTSAPSHVSLRACTADGASAAACSCHPAARALSSLPSRKYLFTPHGSRKVDEVVEVLGHVHCRRRPCRRACRPSADAPARAPRAAPESPQPALHPMSRRPCRLSRRSPPSYSPDCSMRAAMLTALPLAHDISTYKQLL